MDRTPEKIRTEVGGITRPWAEAPRWDQFQGPEFWGSVALGNGTQLDLYARHMAAGALLVSIMTSGGAIQGGSWVFPGRQWVHNSYAAEKLNLRGDSRNVADWINAQLGQIGTDLQGRYMTDCTMSPDDRLLCRFCDAPVAVADWDDYNQTCALCCTSCGRHSETEDPEEMQTCSQFPGMCPQCVDDALREFALDIKSDGRL